MKPKIQISESTISHTEELKNLLTPQISANTFWVIYWGFIFYLSAFITGLVIQH